MLKVAASCFLILGLLHSSYGQCDQPSVTTTSGTHAPQGLICPGQLIFDEEFDIFDLAVWNHERTLVGGGNGEFQWYENTRYNSYVENGVLHIRPSILDDLDGPNAAQLIGADLRGGAPADACTNDQWNGCTKGGNQDAPLNPVKSARVRTVYSFNFKFGKVEIRARFPQGDWLWPALWMLPTQNSYGLWPNSGEIDIMEGRGNKVYTTADGGQLGTQLTTSTLHWGPSSDVAQINMYTYTHYEHVNPAGYDTDFHLFQMEWTPDHFIFSVDNEEFGRVEPPDGGFWALANLDNLGPFWDNIWRFNSKMAPFDQEFYFVFNLAVGGTNWYFPDDAINGNGNMPWSNSDGRAMGNFYDARETQWIPTWNRDTDQAHFLIDYVKVWAL